MLALKPMVGPVKCLDNIPFAVKQIGVNIPNNAGIQLGKIVSITSYC